MTWARLHDQANGDAKLLALSDPAYRMWACAIIYCQNNLTDGFVPEHAIHTFGVRAKNKTALADELCRSLVDGKGPLWHRVKGGFEVHDFLDWNDSREVVLRARAMGKQRMALFQNPQLRQAIRDRDGDVCRYCGQCVRWNDRKGALGGTYDHVDPIGGNALENLVVCCRGCNASKLGRTPDEAGMVLLAPRQRLESQPRPTSKSRAKSDLDRISKSQQATTTTSTDPLRQERSEGAAREADSTNGKAPSWGRQRKGGGTSGLVGDHRRCHEATFAACGRGLCVPRQLSDQWFAQMAGDFDAVRAFVAGVVDALPPGPVGDDPWKFWRAHWERTHGTLAPSVRAGGRGTTLIDTEKYADIEEVG